MIQINNYMIDIFDKKSFKLQSHIKQIEQSRLGRACLEFPSEDKIVLETRKKMTMVGETFLQFYFTHFITLSYEHLNATQIKKASLKFTQHLPKMAQIYGLVQHLKRINGKYFTQSQLNAENTRQYFRLFIGCLYTLKKQIMKEHQRSHYNIENQLNPLMISFVERFSDHLKEQNQQTPPVVINPINNINNNSNSNIGVVSISLLPTTVDEVKDEKNYKNLLQEFLQKNKAQIPKYTEGKTIIQAKGAQIMECQVSFQWEGEKVSFKGVSTSKKQASVDSAKRAYNWLIGSKSSGKLPGK